MGSWWSIEVIDDRYGVRLWRSMFGDALVEAALAERAVDWSWHAHPWGVVLEVALPDEGAWERFLASAAARAAFDAARDVITYRGRGGSDGRGAPRKPRPIVGAGAASLPLPVDPPSLVEDVGPRRLALR